MCQKGHVCQTCEQCPGEVTSLGQEAAALGQVLLPFEAVALLHPPLCSSSPAQGQHEWDGESLTEPYGAERGGVRPWRGTPQTHVTGSTMATVKGTR